MKFAGGSKFLRVTILYSCEKCISVSWCAPSRNYWRGLWFPIWDNGRGAIGRALWASVLWRGNAAGWAVCIGCGLGFHRGGWVVRVWLGGIIVMGRVRAYMDGQRLLRMRLSGLVWNCALGVGISPLVALVGVGLRSWGVGVSISPLVALVSVELRSWGWGVGGWGVGWLAPPLGLGSGSAS